MTSTEIQELICRYGDCRASGDTYNCTVLRRRIVAALNDLDARAQAASVATTGEHVEGFLCKAWGETDLPEARLVRTREEWEAFVVEAQWGSDTGYAQLDAEDREMVVAQVRYIAHDMADNGEGSINFEIGGVSVERVTFPVATPPAAAGAAIPVLNALEVLGRMNMPHAEVINAAEFLRRLGAAGLWVIANPLAAAAPTAPSGD